MYVTGAIINKEQMNSDCGMDGQNQNNSWDYCCFGAEEPECNPDVNLSTRCLAYTQGSA